MPQLTCCRDTDSNWVESEELMFYLPQTNCPEDGYDEHPFLEAGGGNVPYGQ